MSGLVSAGGSSVGCPSGSTSTYPRSPLLWRLLSNSVARVLLNSAPSHSASVALRTCSLEHFSRHAWISRKMFLLATPQPRHLVQSNLFCQSACCCATPWLCHQHGCLLSVETCDVPTPRQAPHVQNFVRTTLVVLPCAWSLKVGVRIGSQQLSICWTVTQQAVGQTQTGSKHRLMGRKTRPIAKAVSRVATLSDCRFKLHFALNVAFFIHVPQLVFERRPALSVLPFCQGLCESVKTPAALDGEQGSLAARIASPMQL